MQDENTENQDSLNTGDEGEASTNTQPDLEERLSKLEQEIAKQREIAENQRIRAEKAEKKAKEVRQLDTPKEEKQDTPDIDERILKANGMPEELIKELKVIAKARDIGLIEAQNDNLFKLVKENFEKETKQKEASLGSSRGSGNAPVKKTPSTPGLSKEEHKAMWKQMLS
jgi:hypothetical protein